MARRPSGFSIIELLVSIALLAGATGAMTGFAYPEILVRVVALFRAGRIDEAADSFYRAVPLMRFEFLEGVGMAIRKEVLRRRGALTTAVTRAPAVPLDRATGEALDRVLKWTEAEQMSRDTRSVVRTES